MAALYQKYRPQSFSDVVGQDALVRVLVNASAAGKLSHAYLFTGSRGVGKTTLARLVAKAANCTKLKNGEPCAKCPFCRAIADGSFLDVIEIDAASHTGVDNVRELIDRMQFKPLHGRMKVFIIDEVHMLSKAAFNALLKSLEEPPEHAMFILATTDIDKVPETIVSRTQRLDFRRIPVAEIIKQLEAVVTEEKLPLPKGAAEVIAENADGGMRDALSMLGTAASLGKGATIEDVRTLLGVTPMAVVKKLLALIANHQSSELPGFFEEQNSLGADFLTLNRNILEYLRQLLVERLSGKENTDADGFSMELPRLMVVIRLFLRSYKEIGQAPSSDLPVLLAAIEASMTGAPQSSNETVVRSGTAQSAPVPPSKPVQQRPVAEVKIESPSKVVEDSPASSSGDTVTLQEVDGFWPALLHKLKENNGSLATVLRNAKVHSVDPGRLVVAVKYQFHKENIENKKNVSVIQGIIRDICGKNITLRAVVMKPNVSEEPVADTVQALNDALTMFGGEVVEQ